MTASVSATGPDIPPPSFRWYVILGDCRPTSIACYVGARGALGPYWELGEARLYADKYTAEGCRRAHTVKLVGTCSE